VDAGRDHLDTEHHSVHRAVRRGLVDVHQLRLGGLLGRGAVPSRTFRGVVGKARAVRMSSEDGMTCPAFPRQAA